MKIEIEDIYLKQKNKKVNGLMKDKLRRKTITKFVVLRPKTNNYLRDDGKENKEVKKVIQE